MPDERVDYYNTARPHQSLKMDTPAQRFTTGGPPQRLSTSTAGAADRTGEHWVSRKVCANGIVCVS